MFKFLINLWAEKRVTDEQITDYRDKKFITPEEAKQILQTPQP